MAIVDCSEFAAATDEGLCYKACTWPVGKLGIWEHSTMTRLEMLGFDLSECERWKTCYTQRKIDLSGFVLFIVEQLLSGNKNLKKERKKERKALICAKFESRVFDLSISICIVLEIRYNCSKWKLCVNCSTMTKFLFSFVQIHKTQDQWQSHIYDLTYEAFKGTKINK